MMSSIVQEPETISATAVRDRGGRVWSTVSGFHADLLAEAVKDRRGARDLNVIIVGPGGDFECGFLTDRGRFVTTVEATRLTATKIDPIGSPPVR